MKNFIIAFCVFLVWSFFGLWIYHWLQEESTYLQNDTAEITTSEVTARDGNKIDGVSDMQTENKTDAADSENARNRFSSEQLRGYSLEGDILFSYEQPFRIEKNSDVVIVPEATESYKYKLNTYLLEHPNTELHIKSQYSAEEQTTSPNLGVQRAQKIKSQLIALGIAPSKIVIKPHITPIEFNANGSYSKAFLFEFHPLDLNRIDAEKNTIPETKIIYPRFSVTGVLRSRELDNLLEEVRLVFENNQNLTVNVIGHTDNVGNAEDNYQLGLELARQVRWFLVAKGPFSKHRVKALSKGESEAIASNQTKKGRSLNQRIEIQFTE